MKNTEQKMVSVIGSIAVLERTKERLIDQIKLEQEVESKNIRDILGEIKRDASKIIDVVDVVLK